MRSTGIDASRFRAPIALLVAALLMACAGPSGQGPSGQPAAIEGLRLCEEPRPQVCTLEYAPVCAVLDGGERKEFASGCSACGDKTVTGHVEGPCPGSETSS